MENLDFDAIYAAFTADVATAEKQSSASTNLNRWQRIVKAFCEFKGIEYKPENTNKIVNNYIEEFYAISKSYETYRKGVITRGAFWKNTAKNFGIEFTGKKDTIGGFSMPKAEYTYTTKGIHFVDLLERNQVNEKVNEIYTRFKDYILWGETLIENALTEFETFFKISD